MAVAQNYISVGHKIVQPHAFAPPCAGVFKSFWLTGFLVLFFWIAVFEAASAADSFQQLQVQAKAGDGIFSLMRKYQLHDNPCNLDRFLEQNKLRVRDQLILGRQYHLPIFIYQYNGQSIRSTIGNDDWDRAVEIQAFNETLFRAGVKMEDYRKGKQQLWVPLHLMDCEAPGVRTGVTAGATNREEGRTFPIFGPDYEYVPVIDQRLTGYVFYLIAGHGGPDPGAIGRHGGHNLCEDEYAYDVTLRLARRLLEHSATVYVIIRDPKDGIRDQRYLLCDRDEVSWPAQPIPVNHLARLQQRTNAVNRLYDQHRKEGNRTKQYVFDIHIDSREKNTAIDMFFYHHPNSRRGRRFAQTLKNTVDEMYNRYRPGRGYNGFITGRDLYVLRETRPPAILVELGNITNPNDQQRIIIPSNRQAIANWLAAGVLKYAE